MPPKVDKALAGSLATGAGTHRVIVTVAAGYGGAVRNTLEKHGDRIKAEFASLNLLVADLPTDDVFGLAKDPAVTALSLDGPVHASQLDLTKTLSTATTVTSAVVAPVVTTSVRQTLGLPAIGSTSSTLTGSHGIGVAVIDSGIAPLGDFGGRILRFYDFTRGGISVAPYDDNGHGTHVAGLIGSSGLISGYAFQGVAPSVFLTGLKVLDAQGSGSTSDVIAALQYVTANRLSLGVQIVNMSLGHPIYSPARRIRSYRPYSRQRPPG